jgi:hypothetical protein
MRGLSFMNSPAELPDKKAYRTPCLIRYGSLTEMTASTGTMSQSDNNTKAQFHKTA